MMNLRSSCAVADGILYFVEGDVPEAMHQLMAATLDKAIKKIKQIQKNARSKDDHTRPKWPVIVLRSLKGWTGPKEVDGLRLKERSEHTKCQCLWTAIIRIT